MPEPPPRKRFQIHLSTAIAMMFIAGAVIWLNTRQEFVEYSRAFVFMQGLKSVPTKAGFGWPYYCVFRDARGWTIEYIALAKNLIAFVIISLLFCFLSEYLIRRHASGNGA